MNNAKYRNRRFWYFEGDWYYEQYYEDAGYQVIRYQVLSDGMHKLFNGKEYPFSHGERQTLLKAINRYYSVISKELYGVSRDSSLAA